MRDTRDPRSQTRDIVDDPPLRISQRQCLGWLVTGLGLAICTIAAASACHAPLHAEDEELAAMTLALRGELEAEPAAEGREWTSASGEQPLQLRDQVLARLRQEAEAGRARWAPVHQFRWSWWRGKWWFLIGLAALGWGGMIARQAEMTTDPAASGPQGRDLRERLATVYRALERTLEDMRTEVDRQADKTLQCAAMLRWLDQIAYREAACFLRHCLEAEAAGLEQAGEMLKRMAVTERHLNRAYSAAADLDLPEAMESVEFAVRIFMNMESLAVTETAAPAPATEPEPSEPAPPLASGRELDPEEQALAEFQRRFAHAVHGDPH